VLVEARRHNQDFLSVRLRLLEVKDKIGLLIFVCQQMLNL
jgi:hypothetical protein